MRIRYLSCAVRQIDSALGHIEQRSPVGASSVEARLSAILTLLKSQPQMGTSTSVKGVRRIHLTPYPYLIDYAVRRDGNRRTAFSARGTASERERPEASE